jgi:ABC-type glutathione transport system ATPase component
MASSVQKLTAGVTTGGDLDSHLNPIIEMCRTEWKARSRRPRAVVVVRTESFGAGRPHVVSRIRRFDVPTGQTLGLSGESGSDRSTVGKATLGLVRPAGGRILFRWSRGGELVSASWASRRLCSSVRRPLWSAISDA